jgi:hypothetical protein
MIRVVMLIFWSIFPGIGLLGAGRMLEDPEAVLDGVRVDLVPASDLKPDVRDRVEREAVPL